MSKIKKLKHGGYVVEVNPPNMIESITDHTGTTAFVYLMEKDFQALIEEGKQHLAEDNIPINLRNQNWKNN